jgi:RNA methyltransferase, TrmH family
VANQDPRHRSSYGDRQPRLRDHNDRASTAAKTTFAHPKSLNPPEHKVAGRNACLALFANRPTDIRRVYVTDHTLNDMRDVLRWCAEQRIAYHIVADDDLSTICETVHHDGVAMIARERHNGSWSSFWRDIEQERTQPSTLVLLENVKNPHNLGAILRVCAHFGVSRIIAAGETPKLSPAVMRTAEGGAEHCELFHLLDAGFTPADVLGRLARTGYVLLATSSHASLRLGNRPLPPRCVLMFGSEGDGLSREAMAAAHHTVAIPGSGRLESLNVACAASVLLWEAQQARQS